MPPALIKPLVMVITVGGVIVAGIIAVKKFIFKTKTEEELIAEKQKGINVRFATRAARKAARRAARNR